MSSLQTADVGSLILILRQRTLMAKRMRKARKEGDHGLAKRLANKLYNDLNAPDLMHECQSHESHEDSHEEEHHHDLDLLNPNEKA